MRVSCSRGSGGEKDALLVRVASGQDAQALALLLRGSDAKSGAAASARRTAGSGKLVAGCENSKNKPAAGARPDADSDSTTS